MTRILALTRREMGSYFFAPVPYVVMFFFQVLTWVFFLLGKSGGQIQVSYQPVFWTLHFVLLFLVPLLTMNTVAEERSRNTLETLLTAPVHDWQVIASKWLGAFAFYLTMLAPTLVYWAILSYYGSGIGKPDTGPVLTAYLGAMLLGGLYIAIGIFASTLTEDSLLSAFFAFFILMGLMIAPAVPDLQNAAPEVVHKVLAYVDQAKHFESFLDGHVTGSNLLYFGSMTLFFLFLAVRALESRKWR